MIIEQKKSDIQIQGDLKTDKVSIDQEDISHIISLLSTNLYSDPVGSFIQEIVSNAIDSHKEAGTKDPVIVELNSDTEDKEYVRITDFGTGISPEEFNRVYKKAGKSTKRESNNYIGSFGIGKFSALACADQVYLTSYYEGTEYKYLMYIDGNDISFTDLTETLTERKNGFSVMLYPRDNYGIAKKITDKLEYFDIAFLSFENYPDIADRFNKRKIKNYNNFCVSSIRKQENTNIKIGNVKYSLKPEVISYNSLPITLKFEIGELTIAPTREEIRYTQDTIDKIKAKYKKAEEEVKHLLDKEFKKDFTNILDYYNFIVNIDYRFFDDNYHTSISHNKLREIDFDITYKGIKYDTSDSTKKIECVKPINILRRTELKQITWEKFTKYRATVYINDNRRIILSDFYTLNKPAKEYLKENYSGSYLTKDLRTKQDFIKDYLKRLKTKNLSTNDFDRVLLNDIYSIIQDKVIRFTNEDVPKDWLKDYKEENSFKSGPIDKTKLVLHKMRSGHNFPYDPVTDIFKIKYDELNQLGLSIYEEKDGTILRSYYKVLSKFIKGKWNIFEIAERNIKHVKNKNNFIHIKDFLDPKYFVIRKIATSYFIYKDIIENNNICISKLYKCINPNYKFLNNKLYDTIDSIDDYIKEYEQFIQSKHKDRIISIYHLCKDKKYLDNKALAKYNSIKKYLEGMKLFKLRESNALDYIRASKLLNLDNIITDLALKYKLFIPHYEQVKKLREEGIFNKQEDNKNENI